MGYATLTKSEQGKIDKVVDWLKYSVKGRPYTLPVYRSRQIPGKFIVRPNRDLRLVYHTENRATVVVVDDIFRRPFVVALSPK